MVRSLVVLPVLLILAAACSMAQSVASVDLASLSASDAAAFSSAVVAFDATLAAGYPLPRDITARLGWPLSEWTTFVQGLLGGAGYDARVVIHAEGSGSWTSLLVGLPLPSGRVAYVPVVVNLPSAGSGLGDIAWAQQGGSFDPRYASFTGVLSPSGNAAPTFSVTVPGAILIGSGREFLIVGADPEADHVGYVWAVDGVVVGASARRVMTVTFPESDRHVLTVTAYDKGGASTVWTGKVNVLTEVPDCGCGQ
jgi:hypothetical protein